MQFKLDSLTQQLQLAKDEADRTSKELVKKSEDFANYRHEKHAALAHLQSAHDASQEALASAEGTLKALRNAHNTQSRQLAQSLTRIQDLSARIGEQDATYASEVAGLRRLIEMVEAREAQSKTIVENVEQEWAAVNERADRRESALRDQVERERSRTEAAEARVEELERVLERVNHGEFPVPAPGTSAPSTPARGGSTDMLTQGIMGLSPTVAIASRAQRSGKTFTEVYADHVRLQDEYAKKCAEYDRMDRTLGQVLAQIEERVCFFYPISFEIFSAERYFRRQYLLNNVPSTNDCNPRQHNSRPNSPMLSPSATPVPPTPPNSPNASQRPSARMTHSKSN